MKVLNIGSLNYDYVYYVDHIISPGETMTSSGSAFFYGGKGFNQSVALSRAGLDVCHAGLVGSDGQNFIDECASYGISTEYIQKTSGRTGHTIIQIDKNAQNSILLFSGSNREITKDYINNVLKNFEKGDFVILQNEVSNLDYIIEQAYQKEMKIVLNPSPFDSYIDSCDLSKIDYFFVNEIEGKQITRETNIKDMINIMLKRFPKSKIILTLGERGAVYIDKYNYYTQEIFPVKAVDTTAAGDTFTGFFIASIIKNHSISEALKIAAKASSIAVTRKGAAPSIPSIREVMAAL